MAPRQKALMLGCGHSVVERRVKSETSTPEHLTEWTRLDNNPDCKPDVLFNLDRIEHASWLDCVLRRNRLPFPDDYFDEIHAYEVMEHYGRQGDHIGFFTGMRELWRILKPGGKLLGTCPSYKSVWAWGDPSHRRIISGPTLVWLSRDQYKQLGTTPASDYRTLVDPCWWIVDWQDDDNNCQFGLIKEA